MQHPTPAPVTFELGGRTLALRSIYESLKLIERERGIFIPRLFRKIGREKDQVKKDELWAELNDELMEHAPFFLWALAEVEDGQEKPPLEWFEKYVAFSDLTHYAELIMKAFADPARLTAAAAKNGTGETEIPPAPIESLLVSPNSGESTSSD